MCLPFSVAVAPPIRGAGKPVAALEFRGWTRVRLQGVVVFAIEWAIRDSLTFLRVEAALVVEAVEASNGPQNGSITNEDDEETEITQNENHQHRHHVDWDARKLAAGDLTRGFRVIAEPYGIAIQHENGMGGLKKVGENWTDSKEETDEPTEKNNMQILKVSKNLRSRVTVSSELHDENFAIQKHLLL